MGSMRPGASRWLIAALLGFLLLSGATSRVAAQADGTPIAADPGALAAAVFNCPDGPADSEIVDAAPACPRGGSASLWIDGAGPNSLDDGGALPLDAGDHTVSATEAGAGASVAITSGETTTIIVVLHTAPAVTSTPTPTETPAATALPVPTTSLRVQVHRCQDKIKTVDDLDKLEDFPTKLGRCSAVTTGIDLALTAGATTVTLADAKPDGDGFVFKKLPVGPITLVQTAAQDGSVFGTAALDPAQDAAGLQVDANSATTTLDLTGLGGATLHLFDVAAPAENRVSIVTHLCASITAAADFEALPDFGQQLLACPVVTLPGDAGPSGLLHADPAAFDDTVKGADGQKTVIADAAFKPEDLCETDIQIDLNRDNLISSNVCIDGSRYQFDDVKQGRKIAVAQSAAPDGYQLGAVLIAPGAPGKVGKVDLKKAIVTFDTTDVGDLTLHVFDFAIPPPVQYGAVQIVTLTCTGAETQTVVTALAPGALATEADLGGADCAGGNAEVRISPFGGDPGQAVSTGATGVTLIPDVPATSADSGQHVVAEVSSGASAGFDVAPDETTRVIFLNYTAVDNAAGSNPDSADAGVTVDDSGGVVEESGAVQTGGDSVEQVVDGSDLPVTGVRSGPRRDGANVAEFFLVLSGALLLAACAARRRSASID